MRQRFFQKIHDEEKRIRDAVDAIRKGGVVIRQTDTIPGFAADATNDAAVKKLFEIKVRKEYKSFILLCSDVEMVKNYVREIPAVAFEILNAAENLPITLIYPSAKNIAPTLMREDGTVAIRIPKHDQTQKLISKTGKPIVSTSVNFSGEKSAASLDEIHFSLAAMADYILYAEKISGIAQPSIVISLSGEKPVLIREGMMNEKLRALFR